MTTRPNVLLHDWRVEQKNPPPRAAPSSPGPRHRVSSTRPNALVVVDMVPFFVSPRILPPASSPTSTCSPADYQAAAASAVASVSTQPPAEPTRRDREHLRRGQPSCHQFQWQKEDIGAAGVRQPRRRSPVTLARRPPGRAFFPQRHPSPRPARPHTGSTRSFVHQHITNVSVEEERPRHGPPLGCASSSSPTGSAMRDQGHDAALHVVYRSFGDVRITDEVVGLVRAALPCHDEPVRSTSHERTYIGLIFPVAEEPPTTRTPRSRTSSRARHLDGGGRHRLRGRRGR